MSRTFAVACLVLCIGAGIARAQAPAGAIDPPLPRPRRRLPAPPAALAPPPPLLPARTRSPPHAAPAPTLPPAPPKRAAAAPAAALPAASKDSITLVVTNDCSKTILAAVVAANTQGKWEAQGFWRLAPGESAEAAHTTNRSYYVYAHELGDAECTLGCW